MREPRTWHRRPLSTSLPVPERQRGTSRRLDVSQLEAMGASTKRDHSGFFVRPVKSVMIDHLATAHVERGTVVGDEGELVDAIHGHGEESGQLDAVAFRALVTATSRRRDDTRADGGKRVECADTAHSRLVVLVP